MLVRALDGEVAIEERTYSLGTPPRDAWPLVQQINEGKTSPRTITVAVELRKETGDGTLLLVGYAATDATVPTSGFSTIDLDVGRSCDDGDGDDFGLGAGCKGSDCDDDDPQQPAVAACSRPDGGTNDGGELCGSQQLMCDQDQECVRERCLDTCQSTEECRDPALVCNRSDPMVCICNVFCDRDGECSPGRCDERGCCVGL